MFYLDRLSKLSYLQSKILFTSLVLLVLGAAPCFSAIYYVDSTNGDDANDGLTEKTPFKTLNKVASYPVKPGDSILFKRGEKWNGTLDFKKSGTQTAPIKLGAYGLGDKPLFTNVISIDSWNNVSDQVYSYSTSVAWCYGLFEDGKKMKQASDASLNDGNWYINRNPRVIYYKPTQGGPADHSCQYTDSYYLIAIKACFVDIENLKLQYAGGGIVISRGSKNINIKNCILSYFYEIAINFYYTEGHCSAVGNTIMKSGDGIYFVGEPGNNHIVSGNEISYCNYEEYNNNDGHAIGIQNSSNNVISENVIQYCINPIAIWAAKGKASDNNIIKFNRIFNCKKEFKRHYHGKGIAIGPEADNGAKGNRIYYNIIDKCNFGIKLKRSNYPENAVYNNVINNCNEGLKLSVDSDHVIFKNNIMSNSRYKHINSEHSTNGTKSIFDHNCYFPDIIDGFTFRSRVLRNFQEWKNRTGQDVYSFISDPSFADTQYFTLQSSSKCVDAGVDVQIYKDYYGNAVPQGKQVDIGVSEFQIPRLLPPKNIRIAE